MTPAVDTYVMQHDLMTGVVPATSTRFTPRLAPPLPARHELLVADAVIGRMASGWRIVGLAAILGLLGSGVAGLALADVQSGATVIKHPDLGSGPLQPVSPPASAQRWRGPAAAAGGGGGLPGHLVQR